MEEINDMLDEAERDFKAGKGIPSEEVFREIEEAFEKVLPTGRRRNWRR